MSKFEVVGSLLLYATATNAEAIKQVVIDAEGEGNVVVDIIPIYEGYDDMIDVTAVFLKVAGSTRNRS
ncbi:hypothetical protein LCGC14_2624100 [marine sediment metagenome]|uniref:Uncharacterized protein n=1 Tax=marine sediment metagenome TaxID=412755 RepID=A0A0F9A267_9ZZZZ